MRHGRGFRGMGRGTGRMNRSAGRAWRPWGDPVFMSWFVSLLPAIWNAFNDARGNRNANKGPLFFENPVPAAGRRSIPEPKDAEYKILRSKLRSILSHNVLRASPPEQSSGGEARCDKNVNTANKSAGEESTMQKARVNVDRDRCTGCGICAGECPNGAITVGDIAVVDGILCAGCGACVEACPIGALSIRNGR
jgi:ferredoxin